MPYTLPTREGDAIHIVRVMGRLAQMLLELRDEYEHRPRADTLEQIDRRLGELIALRDDLRARQGSPEPAPSPPAPPTEA